MEMLPTKVQGATRLSHKYWTEVYSSHAETCEVIDLMEAELAMQARSQNFFIGAQMEARRMQGLVNDYHN